jgi:Spy/CpxP family protein refolding chaperone
MDELGNLRQALSDQITADMFDEAAIRDHASQLAELEADLAVTRAQHAQEIRGMLTDEQWAQFKKIRQHRERSAMGMGQRRGPGDHPGGQQRGR